MKKCLIAVLVLLPLFLLAADAGSYKLKGTIGKREVVMEFQVKGATLTGTMRNKENGKEFQLQGVVNAGGNAKIRVMEGGKPAGVLNGTLTASGFTGTWKAVEGSKEMPCQLAGNFVAAAPPPPPEQPPAAAQPAAAPARAKIKPYSGSIANETLGGLRMRDPISKIISRYGTPPQPLSLDEGEDGWWGKLEYPALGLICTIDADDSSGSNSTIFSMTVSRPGILTGAGVGVGSSLEDVKKTYPRGQVSDGRFLVEDTPQYYSPYLSFALMGDQVREITLAVMMGP